MPPAFKSVTAAKAGTLVSALKDAGESPKKGDVLCYALTKATSVSARHEVALLKGKTLVRGDDAKAKLKLKSGAKKLDLTLPIVPAGFTCFVQSTSHNRKVSKGTQVLWLPSTGGQEATSVKRKPAAASVGDKRKLPSSTGGADISKRLSELKAMFMRFGELSKPAKSVPDSAPPAIREMMKLASEWHVQKDSCGVFGLNFFDAKTGFLSKEMIMGDKEMVQEWKGDHASPNCGEDGWECFGCCSEFDYFFVDSSGATRRIVNNCCDDMPFTEAPFTNFLAKVEAFAKKYVAFREKCGEDWEDEEPPQFL
eukprot:TRINITY_DN26722_c0_g2_i1.p1 TRINITY_DN26722_c0_g2~~TRINITY_DN26722_c0_g2_i1.p1  ORF type:complete len:328 (+),score=68.93 TRINITY_DN26722_c0_g2_i1:55-984(+)